MNPVYVAIDTPDLDVAEHIVNSVGDLVGGFKFGTEFLLANSTRAAWDLAAGRDWFLDAKLHDISNTVGATVRALVQYHPTFISIHSAGGAHMLRVARYAAEESAIKIGSTRPKLLAVTELTSLPASQETVLAKAVLAKSCGMDGVICSPQEVSVLRKELGDQMILVTPGIRMNAVRDDDQTRTAEPRTAIESGANIIVVGRPITQAEDPRAATQDILENLNMAGEGRSDEGTEAEAPGSEIGK